MRKIEVAREALLGVVAIVFIIWLMAFVSEI